LYNAIAAAMNIAAAQFSRTLQIRKREAAHRRSPSWKGDDKLAARRAFVSPP